ncbi:hypothetical protein ABFS82_06G198100 [Erythranthe guttata]|uniref:C2 domain-containing protein n=1 Tax=Erythranthe guttata TaxID=4155 RepID=A0A022RIE6_ERYGU|nr:PREDICTED: uncharacterized protein LOC105955306 [Erythranthe guttata]EYU39518.1 hypothetical protein MIMGU_mgv1a007478mg [Erythranthe guttata]|eukprot:XP_012834478.1 PREDICTED: uncharacterized protein LOC105955306 [Erythranthe guttata]
MDPTIPTPTVCSTVTSSSISTQAPPHTPLHLLEISLISAQDLTPITKSMRTYAIAWVNPNRKLTTRTDQHGNTHPTWNDKLTFRVDSQFLASDDAAITVEIYTVSWFRDVLVGTVRVLISDLMSPPSGVPLQSLPKNMRFVALQVRRPSGAPQGILNMGVSLLDTSMQSMPLQRGQPHEEFREEILKKVNALSLEEQNNNEDDEKKELEKRIHLWRSLSVGSGVNNDDDEFPQKGGSVYNGSMVNGSMCNGSMVNGSELCSDIGPSASIVAAEMAMKPQMHSQPPPRPVRNAQAADDTGSSILEEMTMEEARAKGYRIRTSRERWRKPSSGKSSSIDSCNESELSLMSNRHSRRNSDGGLFSCFAYGIEFTIVCGASNNPPGGNKTSNSVSSSRRKSNKPSEANSA